MCGRISFQRRKEVLANVPTTPKEIGINKEDVIYLVCSRDIRDKYSLSSLLWDIGYLDEFVQWLNRNI